MKREIYTKKRKYGEKRKREIVIEDEKRKLIKKEKLDGQREMIDGKKR